jgi:WD40 repeat protein
MNRWLVGLAALLTAAGGGAIFWFAMGTRSHTPPALESGPRSGETAKGQAPAAKGPVRRRLLRHTRPGRPDPVTSVCFSPDGKTLASAGGGLKLWDIASDKEKESPPSDGANVVAFSPDGNTLAWGGYHYAITVWDVPEGKQRFLLRGTDQGPVTGLCFSPDGKVLASSHDAWNARLWDLEAGREMAILKGPPTSYRSVHFRKDGKTVVTADQMGTRLWDVATGKVRSLEADGGRNVTAAYFSPDGQTLASGSDVYGLALWDMATEKKKASFPSSSGAVFALCFGPDGKTLAAAEAPKRLDGEPRIVLWDVGSGRERLTLPADKLMTHCLQFSPDGKSLACANGDGTVSVWELEPGD